MNNVSSNKDKVEIGEVVRESAATLSIELNVKAGALPFFSQPLRATAQIPIDLPADGSDLRPHLEEAWRRAVATMKIEAAPTPAIRGRRLNAARG